jgi:aminoglycoside phosphotransferase (APT) family kinase protein
MPAQPMPAAEVEIDAPLVRALLDEQHPDLASLPLGISLSGWDNVMYRLGDDLVVRLPRRALSASLIEHEQRWLPELARRLPLPTSAPVRSGRPGRGYPWSWSVCRWLPGESAAHRRPRDDVAAAAALGGFLAALHHPAPSDYPANPYRGVPLASRDTVTRERVAELGDAVDGASILTLWEELLRLPEWAGPPLWLHGDLHPGNVLVHQGALSGVVDFGDVTAGDPASDLSVAWMLFPADARAILRAHAGPIDDHTWARARGWALLLGVAFIQGSADNAVMGAIGDQTIEAVLTDNG